MEPEGSLPCPQKPATGPYPEPDSPNPHLPTLPPEIRSNIILASIAGICPYSCQLTIRDHGVQQ